VLTNYGSIEDTLPKLSNIFNLDDAMTKAMMNEDENTQTFFTSYVEVEQSLH
jgi:hypothetical protein